MNGNGNGNGNSNSSGRGSGSGNESGNESEYVMVNESQPPPATDKAVRLGGPIGWTAVAALLLLFAAWLFLQASLLRNVLVLVAALIAACCTACGMLVRRNAGRPDRPAVHRGLIQAAAVPAARAGALPGRLAGLGSWRRREALSAVAGFLVALAPLALGVGSPVLEGKAADLVAAGHVVRELRVESVRNVEEDEHKNGSTYFCTSTVTLPPADGNGPGTRAEFRSEWADECTAGARAFVAYAPEEPQLGAIGDNERALVERQVNGRALSNWWTGIFALPALGLVATLIGFAATARRDERYPRELRGDESVLRVRITGGFASGDNGARPLLLASDAGTVEFHSHAPAVSLARAAMGVQGFLVWHPERNHTGGRKGPNRIGAAFVSDDGWYVHGALDPEASQAQGSAGVQGTAVDAAYEARPLDLDAGWVLSLPPRLAQALAVWAGLLVLLALPLALPGRVVLGIVGSAGLLVFGTVVGMMRSDADEKEQRVRAGGAAEG
ncbi:hypothetical protein QIS99_19150 [Streptomyces sp. B-S-A8]|uniref:DUF3592 domain-containing protein n=1 Tax=Streptomyces solicavernae TaxID=3043614 RepID=A0ABT6RV46_9ACTN|nr:hypothetical protein [Streptomyces sp. B-S-A8]MDI3388304.1 hypothetical protein [Streptomyces sp. B-S-A8]